MTMNQTEKTTATKPSPFLVFIKDRVIPFNALVTMYFTVAGAIDFFLKGAPKLLFGIALVLTLLFLAFCYAPRLNKWKVPRAFGTFFGLTDPPQDRARIFTVAVYVGVGILIFSGAAVASNAKKTSGGVLAAMIPYLAEVQAQLRHVEASNEKIVATLENVKRETSSDPRKELANQGVMWDHKSFNDAVLASDFRILNLFLQGGMQIRAADIRSAVYVQNDKLLDLFATYADNFFKPECSDMLISAPGPRFENASDPIARLAKLACRTQAVRTEVERLLAFAKAQAEVKKASPQKIAEWRRSPEKCVVDEMNGDGPPFNSETDSLIRKYKILEMVPEAKETARQLCESYLEALSVRISDHPEVKKWTAVAKILS